MKNYFTISIAVILVCGTSNAADVATTVTMPASSVFSALVPGQTLPTQFRVVTVPKIASNQFSLVIDEGRTVLRVDSAGSAGSIGLPLTTVTGAASALLEWRWKINRVLDKANMAAKANDDFAARVYVFFDVPMESLSFVDRTKLRLARMVAGPDVPTAAICYVWDNTHPAGHTQWSPYTNRVRMIVLQSGTANVEKWMTESRDVVADFRAAFDFDAPAITGVAVGNDTDNTKERVSTWYGDVTLRAR